MIKIIAVNHIKPESAKTAEGLFREIIAETRKEEGCIEYRVFTDPKNPELYTYIEEWASQEALDRHVASPHFKRIIPLINDLSSAPMNIQMLKELA
jgi:quinol monooxygenase YgiN